MTTTVGIQQLLAQRSPRERRLLGYAAIVIIAGGALMLVDWSISERERVRERLPQASAVLTTMQADAAHLQHLATLRAPTWPGPDAAAEVIMAAARAQQIALELEVAGNTLSASGSGRLQAILGVIASLQADFGLRPTRVNIIAGENAATTFEIEFLAPSP